MEFLFEAVLQILGEIVLQFFSELLLEFGLHIFADTPRRPGNPVLSALGFILWGVAAGGISLLILRDSLIVDPMLRRINLVATPVLVGTLMTLLGKARLKKGQNLVRLDRFGYAFVFAFSMSLVRFIWAG